MKKELCFSFCELTEIWQDTNIETEVLFNLSYKISDYTSKIKRVYIGSNFCAQYFLNINLDKLSKIKTYCESEEIKITLCVPIFTQRDLERAKKFISEILLSCDKTIDEITVNDYGMLVYITSEYPDLAVNIGRLFHKDTRDKRYDDYYNNEFTPSLFSMDYAEVNQFGAKFYEIDPTHTRINLKDINKCVAVYTPFCYVTVGQICEFASIGLPIEKKFRPNSACNMACNKVSTIYTNQQGEHFYKIGRTVYFKNDSLEVLNTDFYREIYELFELKRVYYGQ